MKVYSVVPKKILIDNHQENDNVEQRAPVSAVLPRSISEKRWLLGFPGPVLGSVFIWTHA